MAQPTAVEDVKAHISAIRAGTNTPDPQENGPTALQSLLEESFRTDVVENRPGEETEKQEAKRNTAKAENRWTRKAVKSLIGLALVIVVGWVPAQRLFQISSVEAIVNARLVTMRAPIGGEINAIPENFRVGVSFDHQSTLFRIVNPRADRSRLDDLRREYDRAGDERRLIARQRAPTKALYDDLAAQVVQFQTGRVRQLEARTKELRSEIAAASARRKEASAELRRMSVLRAKGSVSRSKHGQSVRKSRVANESVKALMARLDGVIVELEAAKKGTFLGDSYNDRPRSSQRADELAQRIIMLDAELSKWDATRERLQTAYLSEQEQYNKLSSATIKAPVEGRIWEVLTAPGEQVRPGQELVRLLDCSEAVITATVSETVYNQLSLGTLAYFRYREGGPELRGKVVRLTGVAAAPANLAIRPSALIKESYRVMVAVPGLVSNKQCQVGRTGRVVFKSPEPVSATPK